MSDRVGEVIAVVDSYDGLIKACVERRHELGLSQLDVDEISGLQSAYVGKLEIQTKRLGVMSLTALLPALGLELVIRRTVPHHERQNRLQKMRSARGQQPDFGCYDRRGRLEAA